MSTSDSSTTGEITLQAEFRIPIDHPCLAGHFPGRPLIPAVVLLDLLCTELLMRVKTHPATAEQLAWHLARIVTARFHAPWLPGEQLTAQIRIDLATLRAQIHALVSTREVASATLQLAVAPNSKEATE